MPLLWMYHSVLRSINCKLCQGLAWSLLIDGIFLQKSVVLLTFYLITNMVNFLLVIVGLCSLIINNQTVSFLHLSGVFFNMCEYYEFVLNLTKLYIYNFIGTSAYGFLIIYSFHRSLNLINPEFINQNVQIH